VIVVIGSPVVSVDPATGVVGVRGLAGRIAMAAAAADRRVQLVGKVGDDDPGDALLLALAAGGVGHAATLRDASHATPVAPDLPLAVDDDPFPTDDAPAGPPAGLPLDPADVQLALRYLTAFEVVVLAGPLDEATAATALDAAGFAGAHVIRLDGTPNQEPVGPNDVAVTQLDPPADDEPAFAELVGRYAAGLDAGRSPGEAFTAATSGTHWERAAD
jgi:sugar/nucleoside kinase (ribokinase family)